MRWAKVPEQLLDALVAVPRDQRESVAPGTALAGYVALAVTANFQTGEVKCTPAQLAVRIDVTPRAARRTLSLLERVGALRRDGDRLWLLADLQVRPTEAITAGQPADSTNPSDQTFSQSTANASQEAEGLHLVETQVGEQMELSPQRDPDVVRWLGDPDRLRKPIQDPALPALRAATRPPRPGTRVPDLGATCSADDARDATPASSEGRG